MLKTDCIDHGYRIGHATYSQRRMPDRSLKLRHRLAYAEYHKLREDELPPVLHTCDNRRCINPKHMFLGTLGDNNTDRHNKGRDARGDTHGQSKLDRATVDYLKSVYVPRHPEFGTRALARQFNVNHTTISAAISGRYWKEAKQ